MWALIKARDLQDPKNKKFMFVDDDLMPLFKTKRVKSFGKCVYTLYISCLYIDW